jgi:hypothetical protein
MKKFGLYQWSVCLFFLILPFTAILLEEYNNEEPFITIAFKWFVFSGIGLRLGSAGLKQVIQPHFTVKEIFNSDCDAAAPIVRELGFANICFGVIALISLFEPTFRIPAAIAGGLYFGLAGMLHVFKQKDSENEMFAMISDFFIFLILLILLILNLQ